MLQFNAKFFEGEWRCDFYVQSEMKRAWAAQIEILQEIDRICRENDIRYFADSGTLLGTIRHKGFIPWDDDMDIAMLREDYDIFCRIAKETLSGDYELCISGKDGWEQPFMRVINGREPNCSDEYMERFHGCPYVVGVDIFPLDYLPKGQAEQDVIYSIFQQLGTLKEYIQNDLDIKIREALILEVEKNLQITFDRNKDWNVQILDIMDACCRLYNSEECEEIVCYTFWVIGNGICRYKKEWYEKSIYLPFENVMVPVPHQYDEVLKATYGDYMKPQKYTAEHDYPFYKKQKEILKEKGIIYTGNMYAKIF